MKTNDVNLNKTALNYISCLILPCNKIPRVYVSSKFCVHPVLVAFRVYTGLWGIYSGSQVKRNYLICFCAEHLYTCFKLWKFSGKILISWTQYTGFCKRCTKCRPILWWSVVLCHPHLLLGIRTLLSTTQLERTPHW